MTRRPRKPWRVTVAGPDVRAVSDHTSERAAYAFLNAALRGNSPAASADIHQWEDGRWRLYETLTPQELL